MSAAATDIVLITVGAREVADAQPTKSALSTKQGTREVKTDAIQVLNATATERALEPAGAKVLAVAETTFGEF